MNNTIHWHLNIAFRMTRMIQVMQTRLASDFYPEPQMVVEAISKNKCDARRNLELARWLRKYKGE